MMDKREKIVMDAAMEGEAVVVRNIGGMVKVSEMEIIILCNLARIACMDELIAVQGESDGAAAAEAMRQEIVEEIQDLFRTGEVDGLSRLVQSCVAMLNHDRFAKWLV